MKYFLGWPMNSVAPAIEFQVVKKGSCLYSISDGVSVNFQEIINYVFVVCRLPSDLGSDAKARHRNHSTARSRQRTKRLCSGRTC